MPKNLLDHINARMRSRKDSLYTKIMVEALIVVNDLADSGPAWTGASAGRADRGHQTMKPSHPAYGMTIGNSPGDSGWQMNADNYSYSLPLLTVKIVNPMWQPYLKYVNYGVVEGETVHKRPALNFLEHVWMRHQQRGPISWR